jgi:hypothetical protein
MLYGFPAKVCRTTQFYHIINIHNNENTGQIAHSAYAINETPSAKMAMSSGFA